MLLAAVVSWVLVLFGLIWLMLETWIWKHRSRIRHVVTGEPIPSASFFELIISIIKNCCGIPTDPMRNPLRNRKRLGDTFLIWRGWSPVVMTASFEDAKNLLSEKGDFFKPDLLGNNPNMNRIFGKSLVAVAGDAWKQQRKTLDPAFKYKKLKTLVPLFAQAAEKLLSHWDKLCDQGPIKVEEGITSMTLDVIGLAGFSYSFGALDKAEDGTSKADSALENYETIMGSLFSPINIFFPSLGKLRRDYNLKLDKAHKNMDKLLFSIIDQHRQTNDKEEDEGDLLDHILALDQSGQLTNREIRDNLFLFFVAGHDTSSSVLTSALYYLSLYPRIQEKAYEEVISVVGEGQITYTHLPKLELISNIIKETCRMRPPVGGTSARKAAHDGVTIGEYVLPEGQLVMPSIFGVNFNEKQWASPNAFNPDRFKGKSTATDAAILSFSLGPHVCIGKKFAIIEMTVALSMIVRKFRFQQLPGYEWRYKPFSLTLKPLDSLPLIVKRR